MSAETVGTVLPNLLVGSHEKSHDEEVWKKYGVTHILNVMAAEDLKPCCNERAGPKYLSLPMSDYGESDLAEIFPVIFEFISKAHEEGGVVYVHCSLGINRSTTTCINFIMHAKKWTLKECLQHMKAVHPRTFPHETYLKKLCGCELTLHGTNSVTPDDFMGLLPRKKRQPVVPKTE